ncbi:alpha/beta hydrolase [Okibacterium endophyticum]
MSKPVIAHPHQAFTAGFYRNDDFDFDVRIALGLAPSGGADAGEVLQAIASVGEKDVDGWFAAWTGLGERVQAIADASAAAGHSVSAAAASLRAANYYGIAVNAAAGLADDSRVLSTFRAHRASWDRFVDHAPISIERVRIPYEGTALPGWFVSGSEAGQRQTLIMVNGSDGAVSALWGSGAADAVTRGYNVLLFDGPGQQSMLFEHNVGFRPDWEAVITPVVDYLLGRTDVDAGRIAMYGISQAGYWVPRALAFEHRIAAAIADPGVVDVSASWLAHMPKSMITLLHNGDGETFDKEMAFGMKLSKAGSRAWNFRSRPYRASGYFDTMTRVLEYRIDAELAASIRTPLFVTDPEDEQFWPGQSEQLGAMLAVDHEVVPFTAAEGANFHCQPLARSLTHQRMFDWLDEKLGL